MAIDRDVDIDAFEPDEGKEHLVGGKRFSVNPSHRNADPADTVKWKNKTNADVTLFIPNIGAFVQEVNGTPLPTGHQGIFHLTPSGSGKELKLKIKSGLSKSLPGVRFPYTVYIAEAGLTSGGTFSARSSDDEVDVP
jgi:hypothetical protein